MHRRLWSAIYAIGTAGEAWQRTGLSSAALGIEMELKEVGQLQTTGTAAKELQVRLLAHGEQFHTAAGSHATRLESWLHWARRLGLDMEQVSPHEAKAAIEAILPSAKFLWSSKLRMQR